MGIFFESLLWDAATILSVLCAVVYHYFTSTYTFWERLDVPYIKPRIFYGNFKEVIQFKKPQYHLITEFYHHFKKLGYGYGGIYQMREPAILICSPELVRDVCVKNFPYFHDRKFAHDEHFDPLSAHLLALEGQKWKFVRSKLSPVFSTGKLKGMLSILKEKGEDFMKLLAERVEKGEMMEMGDLFARYTMDIITSIAFGLEINAMREDSKFLHLGQRFFKPTKFQRIMQIVSNTYPWMYKTFKLRIIPKDVSDFLIGLVKDTMEYRRKNDIQRKDFLHFLMKIDEIKGTNLKDLDEMKGVDNYNMSVNENSIELTEGVIAAQAFVFFLAGYETSSSAMSSCALVLAERPDIQEKMYQEINEVYQKYGDLTYEAIQELKYVEQVLEETLRTYPPVGLNIRKCTKPYNIPGTNTIIPEGCLAFIPIYSLHYDPEFFPEPNEFRPERFSPENRKNIVPGSYLPFGDGPRVCIGTRLAMMEMKISMSLLVRNFKIQTCEKTKPYKVSSESFFLSSEDGIWVRLAKR